MSSVRFRRALPPIVALALVGILTSCSSTLDDAATVGDEHIRKAEFEDELRDLVGNDDFVALLAQSGFEMPDSPGVVGSRVAVIWLNTRIRHAAASAEFEARELRVSDADRVAARASLENGFGGAEVFGGFPRGLRDRVVEREARYQAVRMALRDEATTIDEADARLVFDANRDAIGACESGRSIAHILVATEAEADAILAELSDGADFAGLAAERSTDTGSGADGGDLGCLGTIDFVPEFAAAAEDARPGEPVGPVQTQYGFHLILVTEWAPPTFDDLADRIVADLESAGIDAAAETLATAAVGLRLAEAGVSVDPRFGDWDAATAGVVAPVVPEVRDQRERRADTVGEPTVPTG